MKTVYMVCARDMSQFLKLHFFKPATMEPGIENATKFSSEEKAFTAMYKQEPYYYGLKVVKYNIH